MIILTNNTTKDEVNVTKLYGQEATLTKEDFIKKLQIYMLHLLITIENRLLQLNFLKKCKIKCIMQ